VHLTQKQVYYFWSRYFDGKYNRKEDEFESAKDLITEFRNVKLLYVTNDATKRRALAFSCLLAKDCAQNCEEAFIDSSLTILSFRAGVHITFRFLCLL
jgi:hypothetical protein